MIMIVSLHADNDVTIQDGNKRVTIDQSAKNLGNNSISIGDHNQNITINQQIQVINNSNEILESIKTELKHAKQNQNSIREKFQILLTHKIDTQTAQIKKLDQQFQQIITTNAQSDQKIDTIQQEIDRLIVTNTDEIKRLEQRITNVEKDISFLMQELKNGNLTALSFYGLHVEGVYLNESFYKGAGIGYERLFNSSMFGDTISLVTNLSFISGTEETIIEDIDKQFFLFDIGVKKPFVDIDTSYSSYGQGGVGYLWGDENSLYLKLGLGIEKYNKKNKIALELNYLGILEKEETSVNTHILGNAEVETEKKYQSAIGLTLSISFSSF